MRRLKAPISRVFFMLSLALMILGCSGSQNQSSSPTADEKAYVKQIRITNAHVSAAQNFLGHTITTLSANITNSGDKTVRDVDLNLAFMNYEGQPAMQQISSPVSSDTPPLKPHQTRAIQISFDHVPQDWNQAPPRITIKKIQLATG